MRGGSASGAGRGGERGTHDVGVAGAGVERGDEGLEDEDGGEEGGEGAREEEDDGDAREDAQLARPPGDGCARGEGAALDAEGAAGAPARGEDALADAPGLDEGDGPEEEGGGVGGGVGAAEEVGGEAGGCGEGEGAGVGDEEGEVEGDGVAELSVADAWAGGGLVTRCVCGRGEGRTWLRMASRRSGPTAWRVRARIQASLKSGSWRAITDSTRSQASGVPGATPSPPSAGGEVRYSCTRRRRSAGVSAAGSGSVPVPVPGLRAAAAGRPWRKSECLFGGGLGAGRGRGEERGVELPLAADEAGELGRGAGEEDEQLALVLAAAADGLEPACVEDVEEAGVLVLCEAGVVESVLSGEGVFGGGAEDDDEVDGGGHGCRRGGGRCCGRRRCRWRLSMGVLCVLRACE